MLFISFVASINYSSSSKAAGGKFDTVWQFAGQGTLRVGVFRELFEQNSAFRGAMDRCDAALLKHTGRSASELLYPVAGDSAAVAEAEGFLRMSKYSQPVLVSIELSLAQMWLSAGLRPHMVLGHSLGEFAAAAVAGVMSLEDCLRLVCARGQLVDECASCRGSMVALRLTADELSAAIVTAGVSESASVAAVNGDRSVVLSGSDRAVQSVLATLPTGSNHLKLAVSHAFHSPLMQGVCAQYEQVLRSVPMRTPRFSVVSTVTGSLLLGAEMTAPSYWIDHLLRPVQFQRATEQCAELGADTFMEIGADKTLTRLAAQILRNKEPKCTFHASVE